MRELYPIRKITKYISIGLKAKIYPHFRVFRGPFHFIRQEHFQPGLSREKAKALFKDSVSMVEIEPFSYCNRMCWFCPNLFIDRRSTNIRMNPSVYHKILSNLREIDYRNEIAYAGYCEPLSDRVILEYLQQAHEACPKALLHVSTNGDYLSQSYLVKLYDTGLRSLKIQAYLPNGVNYADDNAEALCQTMLKRYGLPFSLAFRHSGEWLEYQLTYRDMKIRLYARNFASSGVDRGGLVTALQRGERTCPCLEPFHYLKIDYNGGVMPCCNLRSDHPDHQGYVLAYLGVNEHPDLFDVYTSKAIVAWRRYLIGFGRKQPPCNTCLGSDTYLETKVNLVITRQIFDKWAK